MTVSDLSCYTLQYGQKLYFLKPVTLSATVGLSTRSSKDLNISTPMSKPHETIPLPSNINEHTLKTDVGSLGVCVHIDMTPINISISEIQVSKTTRTERNMFFLTRRLQVCLIASVLYGLVEIANQLSPGKTAAESLPSPEILPPMMFKSSSSPTVLKESTLNSSSEPTIPGEHLERDESDTVKLTAWIQWTITRFSIEMFADDDGVDMFDPTLKLVLDAEDIVSSLDFQSVYLKIKSKIGSANIQHYVRYVFV